MDIQEANEIILDELKKHGALYNAYISSIVSALHDMRGSHSDKDTAKCIMQRLMNED